MPRISLGNAGCLAVTLWITGCGAPVPTSPAPSDSSPGAADSHDDHGAHDHPSEGPHHGDLIELGGEEYHAEVVHGAGGVVTVYILDGAAKAAAPIDAAEVTFNIVHDGQPKQFQLPANPDTGDPAGHSSRFSLTDEKLARHLDAAGTTARLMLTINGKSYTGQVEHHHDHDHAL